MNKKQKAIKIGLRATSMPLAWSSLIITISVGVFIGFLSLGYNTGISACISLYIAGYLIIHYLVGDIERDYKNPKYKEERERQLMENRIYLSAGKVRPMRLKIQSLRKVR